MQNLMSMRYFCCMVYFCCFWACSSEQSWQKTANGIFEYQLFSSSESPKISFGDSVTLHLVVKHDEAILFDSYNNQQPITMRMPSPMQRTTTEELLILMTEGDSLVAKGKYQDVFGHVDMYDLKPSDQVTFMYKVLAVKTKAAMDKQRQQEYARKKGFESTEAMLKERKYVRQKAEWVIDTLRAYQSVFEAKAPQNFWAYIPEKGQLPTAKKGQIAHIYYVLMLMESGKVLDDAYGRANRLELAVGQDRSIIEGLHMAVQQLGKGGKGVFFLPPKLAYGTAGSPPVVPSDAWLLAYIELVELKQMNYE